MRIKSILFLLACFLLSCSFTLPAIACPCDPPCEGCESCEAGVCVDDDDNCTGECHDGCTDAECVDDDDKCDDCYTCDSGSCDWDCTTGQCCDDDTCVSSCPTGECCDDGECVVDCPTGECCDDGTCVSSCPTGECCDDGTCVSSCPTGECCDDGECVDDCPTCKECEDGECEWECTSDFDCGGECGVCNTSHCCVPDESICDGWECAECDTTSMTCVPNQGECPPLGDCVACSLELSCKGSHDFCGSGCQTCDEDTKECTDEWTPIDPFESAPCDPYPCIICQSDECEENDNITSPTGWSSFSAPGIPDTCPNVDEDTCDASGASMIDDCKNTISLKCSTPDGTGGDEGCAYRIFYNQTNFSACVWITGDNSLYYRKATVTGDGTTAEVFYKARHVSFDYDKDESCTGCCCSWISVYFCLNKDLENSGNNPPSPNPITAWRKASDCPENLTEGVACPGH